MRSGDAVTAARRDHAPTPRLADEGPASIGHGQEALGSGLWAE